MKSLIYTLVFTAAIAMCGFANADLLVNFSSFRGSETSSDADATDFINAGVFDDVTGATLVTFELPNSSGPFTSSGLTTTLTGGGFSSFGAESANNLLDDYIFFGGGGSRTVTLSGLTSVLDADTDYRLYLFGIGNDDDQNSTFTFGGVSDTVNAGFSTNAALQDTFVSSFLFSSGAAVSDTLSFDFAGGSGQEGTLNGLAIIAVPEPSSIIVLAGCVLGGCVRRRRS